MGFTPWTDMLIRPAYCSGHRRSTLPIEFAQVKNRIQCPYAGKIVDERDTITVVVTHGVRGLFPDGPGVLDRATVRSDRPRLRGQRGHACAPVSVVAAVSIVAAVSAIAAVSVVARYTPRAPPRPIGGSRG
ncbi:hypothetical protein GCM10009624_02550 [Gordonia sinesedis]